MMSDKLRAGQLVTFTFMNNYKSNATANYRFYSRDGKVDMTGSFVSWEGICTYNIFYLTS